MVSSYRRHFGLSADRSRPACIQKHTDKLKYIAINYAYNATHLVIAWSQLLFHVFVKQNIDFKKNKTKNNGLDGVATYYIHLGKD